MRGKYVAIMIASLLLMSFLLYLFVFDGNSRKLESFEKAELLIEVEEIENQNLVVEEENQLEDENEDDVRLNTKIKGKVREVVEGAIKLVRKDQKIVAIGDSLTQGVGDETEQGGYVGILNHTFEDHNVNLTIENFGKRGNRSDQLLQRLDEEEIVSSIEEADMILITIGANDIMRVVQNHFTNLTIEPFQEARAGYKERLTEIIYVMNQLNPDSHIFLIGFYNPFEAYFSDIEQVEMIIDDYNEASESVTEQFENVTFIPTKDLFSESDQELLADDHFHPNTRGYKLIATRVLDYLMMISSEES
ncbi:SGNH/GDSL hydrolase family protein [Halalkalibacter krulwichiae]|uniref:Spore germination lipase LipC n=1 Tax=Halalkalibacter krulwichiae TaxID=199441 RepID=A0A1X9M9D6_9BACI|nr:SGNH/GDSL hydrolase family protein [Halalkalibacter krulwichiae]ARK30016.1 Spore germination lipase LipC [Halalkalibacter krulwichiae]